MRKSVTDPGSDPEAESENDGLTIGKAIKWTAQFVGVVGGSGAGFTALAFGIGYMVTKSHDAMLGLPTMITTNAFYVRIGALFWPNSLHYIASGITHPFWGGIFWIILGIIALSIVVAVWTPGNRPRLVCAGVMVAFTALIVFAFVATERQAAVLSTANKNLMFKTATEARDARPYAKKIHDLLREDDARSEMSLRRLYGRQLFHTIALIYAIVLISKWRTKVRELLKKTVLSSAINWVFLPVLFSLIGVQLILIPVNYGVLCVTRNPTCVEMTLKDKDRPEGKSYLLSDLSTDTKNVVTMHVDADGKIYHVIYDRDDIRQIRITQCGNPLSGR